jgi:hypothetical protein
MPLELAQDAAGVAGGEEAGQQGSEPGEDESRHVITDSARIIAARGLG